MLHLDNWDNKPFFVYIYWIWFIILMCVYFVAGMDSIAVFNVIEYILYSVYVLFQTKNQQGGLFQVFELFPAVIECRNWFQ